MPYFWYINMNMNMSMILIMTMLMIMMMIMMIVMVIKMMIFFIIKKSTKQRTKQKNHSKYNSIMIHFFNSFSATLTNTKILKKKYVFFSFFKRCTCIKKKILKLRKILKFWLKRLSSCFWFPYNMFVKLFIWASKCPKTNISWICLLFHCSPPPSQPALSKYGTNYFKYFFSQYNGRFSHSLSQNCSYLRLSILPLQVGINFFSSLALFPPMWWGL